MINLEEWDETTITIFCKKLELSENVVERTKKIIKQAREKNEITGSYVGDICGSIYIAAILSGERKTLKQISDVFGISQVTIGHHWQKFAKNLDIEVIL